jgi:hypothetical protein
MCLVGIKVGDTNADADIMYDTTIIQLPLSAASI